MSIEPLVSVVVPVYNGRQFLAESLGSVAAQTHQRLEIVVVDDGSTDGSADLVRSWASRDGRFRPILTEHRGPEHARNVGVAAARGDFIAHLDQDDVAAPTRLAVQHEWIRERGIDVCGTCTRVFGDAVYLRWVPERHDDILREFVFRPALIHSTSFLPATIAKAHPFCETIRFGGFDLLTRLARRYRLGNVPQVLLKYRRHAGQRAQLFADAVQADADGIRARHFAALFPDATAEDFQAVSCVAKQACFADAAEMARASMWMRRLADTDDAVLRDLMTDRWTAACRRGLAG